MAFNQKIFFYISIIIVQIIPLKSTIMASDFNYLQCQQTINEIVIKVEVRREEFRSENHKIEITDSNLYKIDEREPIGTPVIPIWEISKFQVSWNDNLLEIQEYLYKDCYELNLRGLTILPSHNGKNLMLHMNGSDGAYAYDVYWVFDHNKVHSRFVWQNQDQFDIQKKCKNNRP